MTTKTNIALAELVEKGADADLLREMIPRIASRNFVTRCVINTVTKAWSISGSIFISRL